MAPEVHVNYFCWYYSKFNTDINGCQKQKCLFKLYLLLLIENLSYINMITHIALNNIVYLTNNKHIHHLYRYTEVCL